MWICEHHPEKVRCDYLLNEGAGATFPYDGGRYYGVCVAEKGVFRFRLTTEGVAGHASIPKIGDNALLKMAPLLAAMDARQPELRPHRRPARAARRPRPRAQRRSGRPRSSACAPATRGSRCSSSRCSA